MCGTLRQDASKVGNSGPVPEKHSVVVGGERGEPSRLSLAVDLPHVLQGHLVLCVCGGVRLVQEGFHSVELRTFRREQFQPAAELESSGWCTG